MDEPLPQENIIEDTKPRPMCCCVGLFWRWKLYFSQGYLEIKQRTCSYIWGLLRYTLLFFSTYLFFNSVTLVCMITAVILSLNQKFPVVVFILAESSSGEIDLTLESGSWNAEYGLNFTAITSILQPFGEDVFLFFFTITLRLPVFTCDASSKCFRACFLSSYQSPW